MPRPPWYVPMAWWLHRGVDRAYAAFELVVASTVASFVPPDRRDDVTAWIYRQHAFYLPGGNTYENGLFDWEVRALQHPELPKTGNVLIGGAGGGRELTALRKRGYSVTAFEPNERLATGLSQLARDDTEVRAFTGGYRELVEAAFGRAGVLERVVDRDYALVVLGWGSLSHVNRAEDRRAIFDAIARFAPRAWVLVSFWPAEHHGLHGKGALVDRTLRRLYAAIGAPAARDDVRFTFPAGMISDLSQEEVRALADRANLEIVSYDPAPFNGSALMRPRRELSARG